MKKSEVPPNWAELVDKSSERVTDEHYDLAKMWLFPDADLGDIAMQQANNSRTPAGNSSSSVRQTNNSRTPAGTSSNSVQNTLTSGHQEIDFSGSNDASGISQEDSIPLPYSDSVTDSLLLQNDLLAPPLINLETSGLRQSS